VKKKTILSSLLFILSFCLFTPSAWGVPASPFAILSQQPDGTAIEIFRRGDEFFNWMETPDGYPLVKNEETGYLEYARPLGDTLVPTGIAYRPGTLPPSGARQHFRPSSPTIDALRRSFFPQEVTPYVSEHWTSRPVSGARKVLAIRVGFVDRALTVAESNTSSAFFGETDSVKKYYDDQSKGALQIQSALGGTTVLTVNLDAGDANGGNHPDGFIDTGGVITEHQNEVAFLESVLAKAAMAGVDFASFDTNGDGRITPDELCVYLIVAGYEESGSANTPSVWAHAWFSWTGWGSNHEVSVAGKILSDWAMNGELLATNIPMSFGVICHELGHQFCKLPDLYDVSGNNGGLGHFSLMAGGSWGGKTGELPGSTPVNLDAWSRKYLGWETPQIPSNGLLTLGTPFNGLYAPARLSSSAHRDTEYFLAEVRALAGWDAGLQGLSGFSGADWPGAGILILHVDETIGSGRLELGNDFNRYVSGSHQGAMAVEADGNWMARTDGLATRGSPFTLWFSENGSYAGDGTFTGSSTPSSDFYDGTPSDIAIRNISAGGTTMTAILGDTGSILVTIIGPSSARWSLDGDGSYTSGQTVSGVTVGTYTISFSNVDGWEKPANRTVAVTENNTAETTGVYTRHTGSVRVNIDGPEEARWSLNGEGSFESGHTAVNIPTGQHVISFSGVQDWDKPADMSINVTKDATAQVVATYTRHTGSVRVNIDGPEEARWSLNGEGSFESGHTVENVPTGDHTVSFSDVERWTKPQDGMVAVVAGETVQISGTYIRHIGSLTVNIVGPEDARWSLDREGSYASRQTVENIPTGDHVVSFSNVAGWERPADRSITVVKDSLAETSGTYVRPSPDPLIPDLTPEEIERILEDIANADEVDLGEADPDDVELWIPQDADFEQKMPDEEERERIAEELEEEITEDSEGNAAVPVVLRVQGFEIQGEGDTTGRFVPVRMVFSLSDEELDQIDEQILERVNEALQSGKSEAKALLDEIRIFKRIVIGDDIHIFDLPQLVRNGRFPMDDFFTVARVDEGWLIIFDLLVFDGATNELKNLVQAIGGGHLLVFDGVKDGKYVDPLILAAAGPVGAHSSSGCRTASAGTGALLLLVPLLLGTKRRVRRSTSSR